MNILKICYGIKSNLGFYFLMSNNVVFLLPKNDLCLTVQSIQSKDFTFPIFLLLLRFLTKLFLLLISISINSGFNNAIAKQFFVAKNYRLKTQFSFRQIITFAMFQII